MPGTGTVKRRHIEILSKDHGKLGSAFVGSTRSSGVAPSFQLQDQKISLERTTESRIDTTSRDVQNPSPNLFTDTGPSQYAQNNQDHIAAATTDTPHGQLSEVDQVHNVPVEHLSLSEKTILGPHAIQPDLIEPRAIWNCLPQTENHNNDYSHEQALKPRGSIADKLDSMVEQGWLGGDAFGKVYDDELESHTTESKFQIRDARRDSGSDSLSDMPRLTKMPSYSESASVLSVKTRSESQLWTGQTTPRHVKQKEPGTFVYRLPQKRIQRRAKRSPAINTTQRSGSDSGVHYPRTEFAPPTGKRRAWTLHHLGRSTSNHSLVQREASPTVWPSDARDHCGSEQDHGSTKSPPSCGEGSISKSDFDPTMLRDEKRRQDSAPISNVNGLRRSSSNTKESTRSASRSTSFFRKFPWYKVALVDKQTLVQDLSKAGRGNDRGSRSNRDAQHDPASNLIELSRGVSKSQREYGHEEDENAPKPKAPTNQGPTDEQAVDAIKSYHEASSQSSLQLMTSPQEKSERQLLEQIQSAPERPQPSEATTLKMTEEWLSRNPHQVVKEVSGHAQSPTRTVPPGTQPRFPSPSGSMDVSFESPISGDVLRSLQPQWPAVKEYSRMQSSSYPSSHAISTKLSGDNRAEHGTPSSGTARPEHESTTSLNSSHEFRSKAINLSPKSVGTEADLLPASVHKSDQHGPVRRELKGRGKGIKKIQVTVTFDGAEELVIEATLKKKDGQEHWRTMA